MDNNVVDLQDVLERVQDDRELLLELFDIFISDYAEKRRSLDEALRTRSAEQIRNLAHSIKGASGNISAKMLHGTCAQLEKMAERGELSGADAMLQKMDAQFADLKKFAAEYKKNSK